MTYYVLFVIELATRQVHIAGITPSPNERWMMQTARHLTDPFDGFLDGKRLLIIDRDTKYTAAFRHLLQMSGIRSVRLPPKSPNLNAYAERFVRSIKMDCTDRLIFFGERSLRFAIDEYMDHYHEEGPRQGIGNQSPIAQFGAEGALSPATTVDCQERLGGLLRSHRGKAA